MLTRGGASAGQPGRSNATCGTWCASAGSLSLVLNRTASSIVICENQCQRCAGLCATTTPSNDHSGCPGASNTASAAIRSCAEILRASQNASGTSCGGG